MVGVGTWRCRRRLILFHTHRNDPIAQLADAFALVVVTHLWYRGFDPLSLSTTLAAAFRNASRRTEVERPFGLVGRLADF
jgi:hypothetical protein